MMERDYGGPAFPENDTSYGGMTLRDYFAARAPEDIPWWFECDYTALGERPEPLPDPEDEESGNPFARPMNQDELEAWDLSASKRRYFQWRYAYADAMLSTRKELA